MRRDKAPRSPAGFGLGVFSMKNSSALCDILTQAEMAKPDEVRKAPVKPKGICIMIDEFKEFIAKGNVMDLAVGIIIGVAFTAIVSSLVSDLINPIIGLILGGVDFSNMFVVLKGTVPDGVGLQVARDTGAAVFAYGAFITAVINFVIIAFVVFLLVKAVNKLKESAVRKKPQVAALPAGPTELDVLLQIRDQLAK
jgi:large conductance mechanosensitive channel